MSYPARLILCKPTMLLFAALALSNGCARSYEPSPEFRCRFPRR